MNWTTRRVLVTVKTYPNPSRKYQETVCVAGIDIASHEWLRLYPVPFRDLKSWQRFKKYSVIDAKVSKASDHRPESYKIDPDSIRILEVWDTRKGWGKREAVVFRSGVSTLCDLQMRQKADGTSLGVIRPADVSFMAEPVSMTAGEYREMFYRQADIFREDKSPVEQIPWRFKYGFKCPDTPTCTGHELSIVDWEIAQLFRNMRDKYQSDEIAIDKVRQKWLDEICAPVKNTHFYAGNMLAHPGSFLVLGVFWPPRSAG